jgi:hypothetical protein
MEITAQVTQIEADKIAFIQKQTNQDISEILRLARIDLYYDHLQAPLDPSLQILEASGFIGCCSVESDLSTNYKSVLSSQLNQKYDHR